MKAMTIKLNVTVMDKVKETPEERLARIHNNRCVAHVIPNKRVYNRRTFKNQANW